MPIIYNFPQLVSLSKNIIFLALIGKHRIVALQNMQFLFPSYCQMAFLIGLCWLTFSEYFTIPRSGEAHPILGMARFPVIFFSVNYEMVAYQQRLNGS